MSPGEARALAGRREEAVSASNTTTLGALQIATLAEELGELGLDMSG